MRRERALRLRPRWWVLITISLALTVGLVLTTVGTGGISVFAGAGSVPPPGQSPSGASAGSPAIGGGSWRTLHVKVPDKVPGGTRSVIVFTPRVAHPDQLPVLYLLHGEPGTAAGLCDAQLGQNLITAFRAGARPFILACPDGNPASTKDSEWADNVDGQTTLETFVTVQARRAVEGDHPRPRSMRAIAGYSMGGFGAASLALRHPSLYGQVGAFAGYFRLDDPDEVFGTDPTVWAAHDPDHLVAAARGQRWYLVEARGDDSALSAHDAERFAPLLRQAGAVVQLVRVDGPHCCAWVYAQIGPLADFLSVGWGRG